MTRLSLNPRTFLTQATLRFPDCWNLVDWIRSELIQQIPSCVFVPAFAVQATVLQKILGPGKATFHQIYCLAGLAAWRATQGIYRFDSDLYNELIDMEIGSIPTEVFVRLPEWCIYVELPDPDAWCSGFFAFLDTPGPTVSHLVLLLVRSNSFDDLFPFRLPLDCSLKESILRCLQMIEENKKPHHVKGYDANLWYKHIKQFVSLVLYICSTNADLNGVPVMPQPQKTKRGPRWFPPQLQTVWKVGYRQGPKLKRALELCRTESEAEKSGGTVRPHARRAHWHHYWTKPKDKPELIVKWLAPILVNVDDSDQLVPAVRPVEEED